MTRTSAANKASKARNLAPSSFAQLQSQLQLCSCNSAAQLQAVQSCSAPAALQLQLCSAAVQSCYAAAAVQLQLCRCTTILNSDCDLRKTNVETRRHTHIRRHHINVEIEDQFEMQKTKKPKTNGILKIKDGRQNKTKTNNKTTWQTKHATRQTGSGTRKTRSSSRLRPPHKKSLALAKPNTPDQESTFAETSWNTNKTYQHAKTRSETHQTQSSIRLRPPREA